MTRLRPLSLALALTPAISIAASVALAPACTSPVEAEVTVYAASSLREAFLSLGPSFERAHPGTKVSFHFAGSQELRLQLEHGAKAEVFAAADRRHTDALAAQGIVGTSTVFAKTELAVAVAARASEEIRTFFDLPKARRIVLGAPEVPVGRYSVELLDRVAEQRAGFRAAVEAKVVSREPNVRQVLAKIVLGEADAAILYRTDLTARTSAEGVSVVPIPPELNVDVEYPIALVNGGRADRGRAFIEHVLSEEGREALARAGFRVPRSAARSSTSPERTSTSPERTSTSPEPHR